MRKTAVILYLLLQAAGAGAQTRCRTIVPAAPVVAGESFQVQFVLEGADKTAVIKPPVFTPFRFVAGPHTYWGSVAGTEGQVPLKNVVYTLEATRPGNFIIPGALIITNNRSFRSDEARVRVISQEEAARKSDLQNGTIVSDYFLRPGEDPYRKMRENLFVKVLVDKKSCYTGEPVQATFKLYSRLESKSDILKNPGFYGFTVYDMVNLADKQMSTEKVNGKLFDVHTIRKVQLYPLQPGVFTVDPMQVRNKVEFSRSVVNKKTEQEIVEGLYGDTEEEKPEAGTEVFESDLSTEPVTITVKQVPEKNKPAGFDGAAGHFSITAAVVNETLSRNEEGILEVTLSGKGNFIQLAAPPVEWPGGVEGFDPVVRDNLDKSASPLRGNRTFRYPFVCATAGQYRLPAISFSFFDTDSNKYRTIRTAALELQVSATGKKEPLVEENRESIAQESERAARAAIFIVLGLVLIILLYWALKKKEVKPVPAAVAAPSFPAVAEQLAPAEALLADTDSAFFVTLYQCSWKVLSGCFGLAGSGQNKQLLDEKMKGAGVAGEDAGRLLFLLGECETALYTKTPVTYDKELFFTELKELLEKITRSMRN